MSDFDKEAEREKLREKYERDKEERQATQRMSDLLLKGATMTNSHCGTCGDPLFQENGTTFCPSCHGNPDAVQGTELEADAAEADAADDAATDESAPEAGTGTGTGTETDEQNSAADTSVTTDRATTDATTDPNSTSQPSSETGSDRADEGRSRPAPRSQSQPQLQPQSQTQPDPQSPPRREEPTSAGSVDTNTTDDSAGDRSAARDSLTRALEKFAAEAAATDDPRYAKECLEAAREASEALESLR
ncbi:hypothetical protein C483_11236 [Natrialba hulunbeirensis JCM 10989]|uniref:Sjogrens syndrome scleroderma autoantigen 1 n=1 Tax=Natrialba hulunbeirensis JCM 10989 TaxID=1227493 RepID=L9ZVX8_9EURY|nr:Sjogren's syndrome/scleroderma autoantigen 1 family protein [Natrialba hulunbeirensis]ELY90630.1 hypothetical protein C483_11236 [Natrialba hulunbeirensis JCM 10989]